MAQSRKKKLSWTEVDSSNVEAVAYDEQTHIMCVKFTNGSLYTYDYVPEEVYVDLVHAESVGKYLNQAVKGIYNYHRWYSEQELLSEINSRK